MHLGVEKHAEVAVVQRRLAPGRGGHVQKHVAVVEIPAGEGDAGGRALLDEVEQPGQEARDRRVPRPQRPLALTAHEVLHLRRRRHHVVGVQQAVCGLEAVRPRHLRVLPQRGRRRRDDARELVRAGWALSALQRRHLDVDVKVTLVPPCIFCIENHQ